MCACAVQLLLLLLQCQRFSVLIQLAIFSCFSACVPDVCVCVVRVCELYLCVLCVCVLYVFGCCLCRAALSPVHINLKFPQVAVFSLCILSFFLSYLQLVAHSPLFPPTLLHSRLFRCVNHFACFLASSLFLQPLYSRAKPRRALILLKSHKTTSA